MINSRSLDDLVLPARQRALAFITAAKAKGIEILVTSTYRDAESQTALYAMGRTAPGRVVTKAKAGQSWHNQRCAFDVVPLVNGKAVWNDDMLWRRIGKLGEDCGLEWAGNWRVFKEFPHFQYTGGLTIAQLGQGAIIT